jgi:glycosyltransferase involved in cell wall biosynthesis
MNHGARLVTNFHEIHIPFQNSFKHNLGSLWQRAAALALATGSHQVSATVNDWQRRLKQIGVRKDVQVIPVGSNIPQASISEADRVRLRNQLLGEGKDLLVAGFGSRHDRDIPSILFGVGRLKGQWSPKLIWIGGGVPNMEHRRRIDLALQVSGLEEGDIAWTGELTHPEVSRLLSVCDIVTLPFVDGVSTRRTSAVTAIQHGLPLLTTRSQDLESRFMHGKNAYLIPIGDRVALADGLAALAREPVLRARLGRGARELFDSHFTWEIIAQQVARMFEVG